MSNRTQEPPTPGKPQTAGNSSSQQGWPGYRTRAGRSGLDPVDNDAETGHMAGVMLHQLLSGKLRTRKPLAMLLLAVLGLACIAPLVLAVMEAVHRHLLPFGAWLGISVSFLFGIVLIFNLVRNLQHRWSK